MKREIRSAEDLLAHAIAIEHEAAERYGELGERMQDLGNDLVGELFLRLARMEQEHEEDLRKRAAGLKLPDIAPGEYAWLENGAPETAARELVLRLLTARSVLNIALRAELRAQSFFEEARRKAKDPELARMAGEMAAEEGVHIAWVESAIRRTPQSVVDWEQVFG
jgi:rubrerythrin